MFSQKNQNFHFQITRIKTTNMFFRRILSKNIRQTTRTYKKTFAKTPLRKKTLVLGSLVTLSTLAITSFAADDPIQGVPGTSKERSFIAIKPDGVNRGVVGEVIKRFEQKGYKLVAIKVIVPTPEFAAEHYDDLKSKPFFPGLVKYFSSGPIVAMVWEGRNVIKGGRKLVGATNPNDAEPGSIRGDLCIDIGRNIIHGSDSADSAKAEITLWFKPEEVLNYQTSNNVWVHEKA